MDSNDIPSKNDEKNLNLRKQAFLYFLFAVIMIGLNILIQNIHSWWFVPLLEEKLGDQNFIRNFYLSTDPFNMPELIGSAIAVVITYIIKFLLDKFIVFKKEHISFEKTGKEFLCYFGFAILTTLENIAIQFILGIIFGGSMTYRIIIALICGYITKFFLDRKYCFKIL
ncbi:GtrA family protein [Promethearchaeum syntrophicum]|uniref:GtrA family protein n=1 Tax=Promethearchaeum syntrophicum TaxID=2594042 RepID=A0A5B9DAS4_9ARCH|nr:GtrA family protein [Candidatus Prometheoarchaeum syntrophicum]QEE16075.1 GtrA-like protein [Candidatus Prometheoarchaeum syntrophicum]